MSGRATLGDCIPQSRPETIEDVIARMEALSAVLPASDGVACFNYLYLETTRAVAGALRSGTFSDPAFLEALDIDFACLYFDALRASVAGLRAIPHAWRPLFERREDPRVRPIQFAFAGMNAHINRDLPVALTVTAVARGLALDDDTPEHRDYLAINAILAATQERAKARLVTGTLQRIDEGLGRFDDEIALFSIERARDAAWINGQMLAHLRAQEELRRGFLSTLDRMVGFAGRGLLLALG